MENIKLIHGDCLEKMREIPTGSIDLILTDPPYGTVTNMCSSDDFKHGMKGKTEWDESLKPKDIFKECERILRENGTLILFSQEPYTSKLITEAHNNLPFSYRMVWIKDHFANGLIAKKAPVNYYEDILIFSKKYDTLNLNPLRDYTRELFKWINKTKKQIFQDMGNQSVCHFMRHDTMQFVICTERAYEDLIRLYRINEWENFKSFEEVKNMNIKSQKIFNLPEGQKIKSNVLKYKKDYGGFHPTQKPVELLKDLIKTYSNEGDIVLDFTMGSGSTLVACKETNRKGIGIELDEKYFKIAEERINFALSGKEEPFMERKTWEEHTKEGIEWEGETKTLFEEFYNLLADFYDEELEGNAELNSKKHLEIKEKLEKMEKTNEKV